MNRVPTAGGPPGPCSDVTGTGRGRSAIPRSRTLLRTVALLAGCAVACSSSPEPPDGPIRLLPSEAHASIGPETRLALILKPPALAQRSFDLDLPADAVLHFGYGIPNSSLTETVGPAGFRVHVTEQGAEDPGEPLFEAQLDPAQASHRRWFDVEADLASFGSGPVTLTFAVDALPAEGKEPPLGVFSDPVVSSARPGARAEELRNVVVISLDTLRARNVSTYGYGRETSPFIDSLAQRAALFEEAITTSVTTGPSHMSLFTGLYPVNHGLVTGLEYKADRIVTLAEALRAAGYQTAAFTEDGYIVRDRGFGRGFSEYTENRAPKFRGPGEVRLTFGQAQRWLERPAREPFHLFVHTYEVHSPYRPPEPYRALFTDDEQPGPADGGVRRQRDNYDREIRFLDDKLRELVGTLESRGLLERTLLVITADHGEEFHEHGRYQHGGAVFDESLRIPLLFLGPGVPPGRHSGQVSLIDVLPTVLDYLGIEAPPDLDGTSLWPVIRGEAEVPERTLFAEARGRKRWLRPFRGEAWSPPLIAVRTGDEKFIVHRPEEGEAEPALRFDLQADADEQSPQPLEGEALRRVDALVDEYLESRLAPEERRGADAPEALDPGLRERLEQLGYLDAEE